MIINVADPPAPYTKADRFGTSDSHAHLQEMIDGIVGMMPGARGVLYFPAGTYHISDTLVFPPETGYHLVGSGMAHRYNSANSRSGCRAAIVWDDDATDKPMIRCGGTGLIWDGLNLWGRPFWSGSTPPPRAGIGIEITKPTVGTLNPGKFWLPSLLIEDCGTAVKATGPGTADSCAFGYFQPRNCDVGVELDGTGATMFTFRFILPPKTAKIFKVNGGGRVYVASINVNDEVSPTQYVLDVVGGDIPNGFFQFDNLTIDGGNTNVTLLENVDSGNGLTHVRFTNMQFARNTTSDTARINIDRSGSTSGQTVVELVGCRSLTVNGDRMFEAVTIKGASVAKPSRLIVRDCELAGTPLTNPLIDPDTLNLSSNYSENRIKNWVFNAGLQSDSSGP